MRRTLAITTLLLCLAQAQAEPLGRLFFTPKERAAMDRERLTSGLLAPPTADADTGITMNSVTFNGHVRRSGGASTVWLNGKAQHGRDAPKQIVVTENAPGEIAVKLPASSRVYPLKVGQTLTPGSGEIREGYRQAPKADAAPKDPPGAANQ